MNQPRRILRSPAFDQSARELFAKFAIGYVNRVNEETFGLGLTHVDLDFELISHRARVDLGKRTLVLSACSLENVPKRLRRYHLIHELAHFLHEKHDGQFWKAVEEFEPNYESLERQLQICFERNVRDVLLLRGETLVEDAFRGRAVRPRLLLGRDDILRDELELSMHCQELVSDTNGPRGRETCHVTNSTSDININTINGIAAPVSVS